MMSGLGAAHQGYEYQDLLVACRLVDVLLGAVVQIHVDEKLIPEDIFDDLTTVACDGVRERVQFKYTASQNRPLAAATFTNKGSGLRLDRVIASVLADRQAYGDSAGCQSYRVVLRDQVPTDSSLNSVLIPTTDDPGPFIQDLNTVRLSFDADALWDQMKGSRSEASGRAGALGALLRDKCSDLSFPDLVWVCSRLVIEVAAPPMSCDLTEPGLAERLLLTRVRDDVGAGSFPNHRRPPADVAAAMIGTARSARMGTVEVTVDGILRRAQLLKDFGAVSRARPGDSSLEVPRSKAVRQLIDSASSLVEAGGTLLVTGPPGQGKTWLCQQTLEELALRGWLVAEHYCYLGDADQQQTERVLAETVFGSLVGRLAEADPRLVEDQRPRYAGDEQTLTRCLVQSVKVEPNRPVAVVIDGIDHITRVLSGRVGDFDPSLSLAEMLASLKIPEGAVLIVLSQPGTHLRPLAETGTDTFEVAGLDYAEISSLAARLGVVPFENTDTSENVASVFEEETMAGTFLEVLADRSTGNALYATYLCREVSRSEATLVDPVATLQNLPYFDGTLENYYRYLKRSLDSGEGLVADLIALLDFAVTRAELPEILPVTSHRINRALDVLDPVLMDSGTQGGIRVYHESFARFLRQSLQNDPHAHPALVGSVTDWLGNRGFFEDSRAFRSLLPLLTTIGKDEEVIDIVDRGFVVRAVAAGFPTSAITANLATAIGCAARVGNWPVFARYVELSRAAESYKTERYKTSLIEYTDVPIGLFGPSAVAERLVYEDRIVMSPREGLQVCAMLDAHGAVAPWHHYMKASLRKAESARLIHHEDEPDSDLFRSKEWWRGRLRLSASTSSSAMEVELSAQQNIAEVTRPSENPNPWDPRASQDLSAPINWQQMADLLNQHRLPHPDIAEAILETHGIPGVLQLIPLLEQPGTMCLAVAEHLTNHPADTLDAGTAQEWAIRAAEGGVPPGQLHTMLAFGAELEDLVDKFPGRRTLSTLRPHLKSSTNLQRSERPVSGRVAGYLRHGGPPRPFWFECSRGFDHRGRLVQMLASFRGWFSPGRSGRPRVIRQGLAVEAVRHLDGRPQSSLGQSSCL